ncbi:MAG: polyprenyl synthetase family protein [Rhodobacterales bacterium]|nr:polyprenyl synthetase family protein [Rhodobacterales bacterium]
MAFDGRIDQALQQALALTRRDGAPPRLAEALPFAVFPGGARVRPTILMSVAQACGDDRPDLTDAAAAALELTHCASLVHDDLPAFDDADLRRGKPTLHRAYGEPLAVLSGDALIVLAFETLAHAGTCAPDRALGLIATLASRTGVPFGICAGQGWESETQVNLQVYHRAKTGALFIAATRMGAQAADHDPDPWEDLGALIGEAFQVADDLKDALGSPESLGKPAGQDAAHHRPSAVASLGVAGAMRHMQDILSGAIASIPACPGEARLAQMVLAYARRLTDLPAAALAARLTICPGSFRTDSLPPGADTISLIRVLYDHPDETVDRLLAAVHAALPPGGMVLVSEPMSGGDRPDPATDVYFAVYTLAMQTGRTRTAADIAARLTAAGFAGVAVPRAPRPFVTSAVTARKA